AESLQGDLDHHHQEPDQPESDMQPVATDKREEGRKKSAALRTCTNCDHVGELAKLESQERGTEREGEQGIQVSSASPSRTDCERHQPASVARSQQTGRLDGDAHLIEDLGT